MVWGDPEWEPPRLRCIVPGAPHPNEAEISGGPTQERRSPQSRRPTTRRCAPLHAAARASIYYSSFRELPLMTPAHLAEPHASSQCCSSLNHHILVAARRHRRCLAAVQQHARRQLKTMRLVPGSIPAHADPCGDVINIGMGTKLFRCATSAPLRLTGRPAAFPERATDHRPLHLSVSRCA